MLGGSSFVLEADTIERITDVIEKKYHNYYKSIVQYSQSGEIVELTNRNQAAWEKQFSSITNELIDNF
jgi:hypothetical protein